MGNTVRGIVVVIVVVVVVIVVIVVGTESNEYIMGSDYKERRTIKTFYKLCERWK